MLCLHETMASVGNGGGSFLSAITVTNPITSEALALLPAPRSWEQEQVRLPGKYSIGYHPTTGRYKVVHVPCGRRQAVSALQVFTVGDDAAWREVPVNTRPGATYDLQCEPISVDGRTYWLDAFSDRMMALDLEDESVASFATPPAARLGPIPEDAGWKLANVRGRLGVVVVAAAATARVEVWVRDGEGVLPHWTRRYDIAVEVMAPTMAYSSLVAAPQLMHGCYILRESQHRPSGARPSLGCLWGLGLPWVGEETIAPAQGGRLHGRRAAAAGSGGAGPVMNMAPFMSFRVILVIE